MMNSKNNKLSSQAILRIDLRALADNYKFFAKLAPTAAVVKANAYGIGVAMAAKALAEAGANEFFVSHINEAIELKNHISNDAKIFVLNGLFADEVDYFINNNFIPVINDEAQVSLWNEFGKNKPCAIHIDTGMNRLGIRFDEVSNHKPNIKSLNIDLVISHLACASEKENPKNQAQLIDFIKSFEHLPNSRKSIAASGGACLGHEFHMDLIRAGIGLYGGNPLDNCENPLKPVAYLYAPILQTRILKKGESLGYGASFIADKNMRIATLGIGYADGFLRSASNNGMAFIDNKICPILGRVSMDLIAIDISNISPNIKAGDMAELLGKNITIDMQADAMNTISYEILTRLGNRFFVEYIK